MTRHLHEPANALLYKALDLPPQDRQRFVDDACVGQPDLRDLVNTLLARISQLDEFLETPADLPPEQRLAPIVVPSPAEEIAVDSILEGGIPPAEPPPTPMVQVRKGNVLAAATAGLLVGALLAGAGIALWQARGADRPRVFSEQRLGQSAKLPNGMQAEIDAAFGKAPSAAREKLIAAAQEYQGQLAAARRSAGQLEAARQAAALSVGFAEKLSQAHPDDARSRRQSGAAHMELGRVLVEQGRSADGLAEMRKALALRESIAAGEAGNEQAARDVADSHATIGAAMTATGDHAAAEQELRLARDSYAAQLRANPSDTALQAGLIELEMARADVQNLQHHGRDAVQSLAALHVLAARAGADPYLAARIALLDAYIQPRGTAAMAYASAGQALAELLKHSEKDPLDGDQQRASAMAWQRAGEIGLRAGQTQSACSYLDLAAKRYAEFEASKRLNAIDLLRQEQLQQHRKACR
jgi:hypothetical protein